MLDLRLAMSLVGTKTEGEGIIKLNLDLISLRRILDEYREQAILRRAQIYAVKLRLGY
jgi:hypothetical protein